MKQAKATPRTREVRSPTVREPLNGSVEPSKRFREKSDRFNVRQLSEPLERYIEPLNGPMNRSNGSWRRNDFGAYLRDFSPKSLSNEAYHYFELKNPSLVLS